jgi:hypothetical protein
MQRLTMLRYPGVAALFLHAMSTSCPAEEACDLPIRFILRPDQVVLYESWDRVPHEFGAGDTVIIDCRNGVFTVNGLVHRPHAPAPPWKVEVLRRLYGDVPFVQDYVANAKGDSVTRWNDASQALDRLRRQIGAGVERVYWAARDSLGSSERAAEAAASRFEQSGYVDSATVASSDTSCGGPELKVFWKGYDHAIHYELGYRGPDWSEYKDPGPSSREACMMVGLMRKAFVRPGGYRVEFVRGNVNMFGKAGIRFSTGGATSTDRRYYENPYVEVKTKGNPSR